MTLTIATSLDQVLADLAAGARPIAGGTDKSTGPTPTRRSVRA